MTCQPFDKCFDFVSEQRKKVVFEDTGSSTKFVYENNSLDKLTRYTVDGCLITGGASRCDFLLLNCDKQQAFFIELKGSDLIKAVEQIDATITELYPQLKDFAIEARIVLTRSNTTDLKSTKLIKLENRLKKLKGQLKKQNRQLNEVN